MQHKKHYRTWWLRLAVVCDEFINFKVIHYIHTDQKCNTHSLLFKIRLKNCIISLEHFPYTCEMRLFWRANDDGKRGRLKKLIKADNSIYVKECLKREEIFKHSLLYCVLFVNELYKKAKD